MSRPSPLTILLGISRIWILGSALTLLGSSLYYDVGRRVLGYSASVFDQFPDAFWPLRVGLQLAVSCALMTAALKPRRRGIRFGAIFIITCGVIAWLWVLRFQAAQEDIVRWSQIAAETAALYGIPMILAILILASFRGTTGLSDGNSTVAT
jgi:hypothetical protein